jgi:hypothetical protein
MAATKQDIRRWLTVDVPDKATHMAVVCDTYDWDDYPVYVMEGEDPHKRLEGYAKGENMAKLMEVYNLSMDIEKQMAEHRAFNY